MLLLRARPDPEGLGKVQERSTSPVAGQGQVPLDLCARADTWVPCPQTRNWWAGERLGRLERRLGLGVQLVQGAKAAPGERTPVCRSTCPRGGTLGSMPSAWALMRRLTS